jgi:hypothetical protein
MGLLLELVRPAPRGPWGPAFGQSVRLPSTPAGRKAGGEGYAVLVVFVGFSEAAQPERPVETGLKTPIMAAKRTMTCLRLTGPGYSPSKRPVNRVPFGAWQRLIASLSSPARPTIVSAERWQSGRSRRTRNAEYAQAYRGFESLPLRHNLPARQPRWRVPRPGFSKRNRSELEFWGKYAIWAGYWFSYLVTAGTLQSRHQSGASQRPETLTFSDPGFELKAVSNLASRLSKLQASLPLLVAQIAVDAEPGEGFGW